MGDTFGVPAKGLTDAYVQMGAMPTFACAPYLPDCRPLESPKVFCGRLARPPVLRRLATELLPVFQALQA